MLLGPDQYGVLAATWVCIQFFLGLSSSWVSTALSSLRVEASQEVHLLGVCLARHLHVLFVLLVALPWMLAVVVPETFSDVPLLVTVLSLGVSTLVGEFFAPLSREKAAPLVGQHLFRIEVVGQRKPDSFGLCDRDIEFWERHLGPLSGERCGSVVGGVLVASRQGECGNG